MTKRILHLRLATQTGDHSELGAFLKKAIPYYESLPGVRIRLMRSADDPKRYIEVVEYETLATAEADDKRMETDSRMRALLAEWRELLDSDVIVERYDDITDLI